jgi:hypothetical protein
MRWIITASFAHPWRRLALAWTTASLALALFLPSAHAALIFPPPEPELGVSINDVTVSEPVSGTVAARFTIRLTGRISRSFTIAYQAADGSARVADGDYQPASGSVTFAPQPSDFQVRTVSVLVKADSIAELDETFFVDLSAGPADAPIISDAQGKGVIRGNAKPGDGGSGDYCDRHPGDPRCEPIQEQP